MKLKFFTSLALLCMFGVGALAQTTQTATKYSVKMNSETADADKWTAKVGSADVQALPVEAAEGDAVTVIYSGTKNVKSVKAVEKDDVIDLSKVTADLTLQNGNVVTGTLNEYVKISIADGATVTLSGVNITGINSSAYLWAGLNCVGDATIILADGTTNTVKGFDEYYPGIHVLADCTLTIQGTGALNATGSNSGCGIGGGYGKSAGNIVIEGGTITAAGGSNAAGIGSGSNNASCGNITISGGTVNATGGPYAAAIGSGSGAACGNITISGGTVNATGGKWAAGIGSGVQSSCGDITISGGTVNATVDSYAAGIGSGYFASCGNITITNTVTSVKATKGTDAPNSIGAGKAAGSCGTVTIGGVVGAITETPYTYTPEQN